jgi:hypothetical protein
LAGKISDQTVQRMEKKPPKEGFRIEWDNELRGFGVRITAAGVASFILYYRVGKTQRKYTIGRCNEMPAAVARKKAEGLRAQINDGRDPAGERQ